ncbi:MAG: type I-U CRISPR-associated protein Csb2 [bacterium]|nr:type I-U CRISPR-associated protein Csb2 [bacterium]
MTFLLLTVRFLDDRYHGLLDRGGPPEWPPSPFRLFQALVAAVARRGELVIGEDSPDNTNYTMVGQAIGWLQQQSAPIIITPTSQTGQAITRFVPNNDGDKKFDRQQRLTAKVTIPTLLLLEPNQKPEVHYVWDIGNQSDPPLQQLRDAARSLTSLGWGIDMAFADARSTTQAEVESLPGIRWHPKSGVWRDEGMLRVPLVDLESQTCTLSDLRHCHETAMNRIQHDQPLRIVDKPRVFDRVFYASTVRMIGRPHAIFKLLDSNDDTFSYSQSKLIHIAGMVRHLAIERMKAFPPADLRDYSFEDWLRSYVSGHQSTEDKVANKPHAQFSFVPLPSIGHQHADPSIRRAMIIAPLGDDAWLGYLSQQLDGEVLVPLPDTTMPPDIRLDRVRPGTKDGVCDAYTRAANSWASFTPVILPGHDDHKPEKTRKLIEKALQQSGIEQVCEFEWSAFSYFPKAFAAHKYDREKRPTGYIRPSHLLNHTSVHLRLRFTNGVKVPGPLAIGSGRHCGLGLMAGIDR